MPESEAWLYTLAGFTALLGAVIGTWIAHLIDQHTHRRKDRS